MSAEDALTPEQRADCAACSRRLSTGVLALAIAVLAAAAIMFAAWRHGLGPTVISVALVALVALELWFALRVAFDARLFARLASGELESLAALDRKLAAMPGTGPEKAGRPLAPRIAGARRLYRLQLAVTLALVVFAFAAWWPA